MMLLEDFLKQFEGLDPKTKVYRWWTGGIKKLDNTSFDAIQLRYVNKNDTNKEFVLDFKNDKDFDDDEMIIVVP
jgi:hypothetical protein